MAKRSRYRFPGMDPWLEHPAYWPGVHNALIISFVWDLNARLMPRYTATQGTRVVVEEVDLRSIGPDLVVHRSFSGPRGRISRRTVDPAVLIELEPAEVVQAYVEIRLAGPSGRLVTVLELLSPSNKSGGGDGMAKYLQKQEEVLSTDVHLVEIDLLRGGTHVVSVPKERLRIHEPYDYLAVIRRAGRSQSAEVYPVRLEQRLPRIPVPLAGRDPDAVIDLLAHVREVYDRGGHWNLIDYRKPPVPPLSREQAAWAARIVGRGRR